MGEEADKKFKNISTKTISFGEGVRAAPGEILKLGAELIKKKKQALEYLLREKFITEDLKAKQKEKRRFRKPRFRRKKKKK